MRGTRKIVTSLLLLGLLTMLSGATPTRSYAAGKFALELDGVVVGWLASAEGGQAYADVIAEQLGPDHLAKKHIGNVKYEEISFKAGTGMSKAFYDWLADMIAGRATRKNGAIIAADYNGREIRRIAFTNALITEISFPALDAASKEPAYLSVKIKPEMTRQTFPKSEATVRYPVDAKAQKKWLPANFRLRIGGLDASMARVNKIEALTIKQKVTENAVGEWRDYEQEPLSVEMPNLVITFPESHADAMLKWHEDFLIQGNSGQEQEKSGTLEFLAPDLKEVLFTLELHGLGIFKLTPDKVEAGGEQIRRVKAELYCEEMRFTYGAKMAQ